MVNMMDLLGNFLINDLSLGTDGGLTKFDLEISFSGCSCLLFHIQEVV